MSNYIAPRSIILQKGDGFSINREFLTPEIYYS